MSAEEPPRPAPAGSDPPPSGDLPAGTHCPAYGAAWNDPASLLAAVLRLLEQGVAPEEMRIIPHIGHVTQPEIVAHPVNTSVCLPPQEDALHALYVNIRPQNRLHWLYPLFRQQPAEKDTAEATSPEPTAELREQDAELRKVAEQTAATLWNAWFVPHLEPTPEDRASLETHDWLMQHSPEWKARLGFVAVAKGLVQTGYATPVQWLARLWRALYPQLQFVPPKEESLPSRLRLVGNALVEEQTPPLTRQNSGAPVPHALRDDATLLAEKFFTVVFLHLAEIDMLEGVAHPMDWTPDPFGNPYVYGTSEKTARVAFNSLDKNGVLHCLMQSWAASSKWIETIFPQSERIGGMSLDGVLLRLMQDWLDDAFLGLTPEDWRLFAEPEAQGLLWMLLLKRRDVTDWGALFDRAVRLLVSEEAGIHLEAYQSVESQLGNGDGADGIVADAGRRGSAARSRSDRISAP